MHSFGGRGSNFEDVDDLLDEDYPVAAKT